MRKSSPFAAALAATAALVVAACGSDGSGSGYGGKADNTTAAAASPTSAGAAIVSVAAVPELGRILVGSDGHTLYDFHKDRGGKSACYGECAGVWPPLITDGDPKATGGTVASKLGTTERDDGTVQVTYAGLPLYTYAPDAKPGEAKGNDIESFGAEWYALMPNGEEPED